MPGSCTEVPHTQQSNCIHAALGLNTDLPSFPPVMAFTLSQQTSFRLRFTHTPPQSATTAPPTFCRARIHISRRSVVASAQLGSMLDTVVTWGAVAASVGATVYAVFYDWQRSNKHKQQQPQPDQALMGPEDNFSWAVMGGVSFIPLFNYMAWVLGALQSDQPRLYYWAAALYALPLLRNGFDQDWFSVTMLLLGAAHIQALRIGATEPELQAKLQQQLKPLAVVNTLANAAGTAAGAAFGRGSSSTRTRQLGEGSSQAIDDVLQPTESDEAVRQQQELAEFDRRLQELSRDKRK